MKKTLLSALALAGFMQANALDYSSESACLNNDYVKEWGRLKLVGNQLCSENGQPVQLRGWSTHGKQWQGQYCFDDKDDFKGMKGYGANIARIAMYVSSYEGGGVDKNWISDCMKWTQELGMYCLIDWHVLNPGDPTDQEYQNKNYKEFFGWLSSEVKSKGYKHVLYEICNEPNEDSEGDIYRPRLWAKIKKYAGEVLPEIQKNDQDAVVMVGTPQWDQAMYFAMEDPIEDTYGLNVMYSFHYYACSHEMYLGHLQAAAGSIPVFVTEWGTTEHKGLMGMCEKESDLLINTCNGANLGNQLISWCNWSFSTEGGESKSLNSANNYTESNLSASGKYIVKQLRKGENFTKPESSTPYQGQPTVISGSEPSYIYLEKYDEGGEGVAYHDYDADWVFQQCGGICRAAAGKGDFDKNYRSDDCLDLGYLDKDDHSKGCNIGYIVESEWVKYTLDVKKAGYYKFIPMACAHNSTNLISVTCDGKNIVRDLKDKDNDKFAAFRVEVTGDQVNEGGYSDWDESRLYSKYDKKNDGEFEYGVYFEKPGIQTIAIAFYTENAGLGPIKLVPEDPSEDAIVLNDVIRMYPNPSNDGNFTVNVKSDADVVVYDMTGKACYSTTINGETSVNANLKGGVYAVKVTTEGSSKVMKLVVE